MKCTNYKKIKTHSAGNVEYVNLNKGFFFFITVGPISVNINATEWMDIEKKFQQVIKGSYRPENCKTRHKVAILVPYRDRDTHLRIFINHMHSFLIRQQLEYGIYIVELVSFLNYFTIRIVFIKRMGEG